MVTALRYELLVNLQRLLIETKIFRLLELTQILLICKDITIS